MVITESHATLVTLVAYSLFLFEFEKKTLVTEKVTQIIRTNCEICMVFE